MDIHDMGPRSDAGKKYLLVVVDKATRFVLAYPLPTQTDERNGQEVVLLDDNNFWFTLVVAK